MNSSEPARLAPTYSWPSTSRRVSRPVAWRSFRFMVASSTGSPLGRQPTKKTVATTPRLVNARLLTCPESAPRRGRRRSGLRVRDRVEVTQRETQVFPTLFEDHVQAMAHR